MVVLLKRLSPSSLVLHLVHHHLDPLLLNRSSPADNSDPIGDALDAIDLDSLASVLATNLQTLRYVGLVVGPRMMWAPRPFWRIRRECGIGEDKERVVLERVPESEGRRAMKEPTNE